MWIASPASPNSAAANGMPTCTVLPKVAAMARVDAAAAPWRAALRRCQRYTPASTSSAGAK